MSVSRSWVGKNFFTYANFFQLQIEVGTTLATIFFAMSRLPYIIFCFLLGACALQSKKSATGDSSLPALTFNSPHPVLFAGEDGTLAFSLPQGASLPLTYDFDYSSNPDLVVMDLGSIAKNTDGLSLNYTAPPLIQKTMRIPIKVSATGASSIDVYVYIIAAADAGYTLLADDVGPYTSPMAYIYAIDPNTSFVPNFSTLNPVTRALVKTINMPNNMLGNNTDGFYGLTNLTINFGVQITGTLSLPVSGKYTFQIPANDGANFMLNNQPVATSSTQGSATLSAGNWPFTISYFQTSGTSSLMLNWMKPGDASFSLVPDSKYSQ